MVRIKIDTNKIGYINVFESITGAHVKDCIIDEETNKVIFLVKEGHAAKSIGKNGINVQNIQRAIKQTVEIVEYSDTPQKFICNFFRPAKISNIYISEKSDGTKIIHLTPESDKGLIKNKLVRAKKFVKTYYEISDIVVH